VVGYKEWAQSGGEAAAREKHKEPPIIEIFTLYIIIKALVERILGELMFIYYGMLLLGVSSIL
jgi:hypothetical protein